MDKVVARGIYCSNTITVEAVIEKEKLKIYVDEKENPDIQNRFNELIKSQVAMGGTFYPGENSLLAAYNVLKHTFFDSLQQIEVQGNIGKIPFKKNRVY